MGKVRVLLTLLTLIFATAAQAQEAADTVLTNGKIYTVNDDQLWAEAVAVKGDEIVYVGDKDGAKALTGDGTKVIDLEGRLTLPGFIESHVHPSVAAAYASGVVLNFSDPMEVVLQKIRAYAEANPDKEVIFGATYNGSYLNEDGNYKKMLDDIVPDRPVYLMDHGGHGAWVNSQTLAALGYDKETVDPPGGIISRLPDGEPNGSLKGAPAHLHTQYAIPVFTAESIKAALPRVFEGMNEYGFTSASDMGAPIAPEPTYAAYQELDREGALTVRLSVKSYASSDKAAKAASEVLDRLSVYESDRLWFDTVKIAFDGVIELLTAVNLEPYTHDGSTGQFYVSPDVARQVMFEAAERGYHIATHAYGDKAVRLVLDYTEELRKAGYSDTRVSIGHGGFIQPVDRPRFAELNVVYETTPVWVFEEPRLVDFIGADRYHTLYHPMRDIIDLGGTLALGSDWPATIGGYEYGLNPFTNIFHAQTRSTATSLTDVWGSSDRPMPPADQAITLEQGIRAYTLSGAERLGKADMIGSIEVGKKADIIVLDQDLFSLNDIQKTVDTKVLLTMFDGQVVHDRAFGVGDSQLVDPDPLDTLDDSLTSHGATSLPTVQQ